MLPVPSTQRHRLVYHPPGEAINPDMHFRSFKISTQSEYTTTRVGKNMQAIPLLSFVQRQLKGLSFSGEGLAETGDKLQSLLISGW